MAPHRRPFPDIHQIDKHAVADLWAKFPIWHNVTVMLTHGDMKGITGTTVERQDPNVVDGAIISAGGYKVRWHDPQYGVSDWLRPGEDIVLSFVP